VEVDRVTQTPGVEKLRRVPLREVWRHEASDFTSWLQDNIDVLNDQLGLHLANAEREQPVGTFSVDLVAEDSDGHPVVIENQLERSDHDHLGKLITYLTNVDETKTAVWIVSEPRPEHLKAVSWLNESTEVSFYLVKIEAIRIGESPAAPLLTQIVGPTAVARQVGERKRELKERHEIRRRFWTALLAESNRRTKLFAGRSPGMDSWMSAGAGRTGLSLSYVCRQHDAAVELYIDRGTDSEDDNLATLRMLQTHKDEIETDFGAPLEWQELEGKRACRVKGKAAAEGYRDESAWPQVVDAMVGAMIRLEAALRPHIASLP
jgi:hypothetical protein